MAQMQYSHVELFQIVTIIGAPLSLIAEILMIFLYIKIKELHTFSMKLIMSLIFSNLFFSISHILIIFHRPETPLCTLQGYLFNASNLGTNVWATIILWITYKQITENDRYIYKIYPKMVAISLIFSLTTPTITLISQALDGPVRFADVEIYCSMDPEEYSFPMLTLPLWIVVSTAIYYSIRIFLEIRKLKEQVKVVELKSLLVYPLAFGASWIPSIISYFISTFFGWGGYSVWLALIHVTMNRLSGVINILLYARSNLKKIKSHFAKQKEKQKEMMAQSESSFTMEISKAIYQQ